jgi:succinate-acetate transporter protein
MNGPFLTLLGRSTKAGGAVGAVTAFVAYYIGFAELVAADGIELPLGKLGRNH